MPSQLRLEVDPAPVPGVVIPKTPPNGVAVGVGVVVGVGVGVAAAVGVGVGRC